MSRKILATLAAAFLTGALAAPVAAQGSSPVELSGQVKVRKRLVENGAERIVLADPKVVVPGDTLVFSTAYRNGGTEVVKNFVITNGVPAGVALAPDGEGTGQVSVDGGKSWGKLAALLVDDGAGGKRPAGPGDVTHLRWVLAEIQPGTNGQVTYQATVR